MPHLLRAQDSRNEPLVAPGGGPLALSYFNLLRLRAFLTGSGRSMFESSSPPRPYHHQF